MWSDLAYRLRALFCRRSVEAELDEELLFHLEHQMEKYRRAGLSLQEAARQARLALGGPEQVREECRDARGTRWLEDAARDVRYALRTLRKSPLYALTAALTIALGIGAATAVFSVAHAVLLRPLPYKNPDRLVLVGRSAFSNADFLDLRAATGAVFEEFGGVATFRAFVPREDGGAEQISRALVTTNFFRLMGGRIAAGRDFTDADGQPQPSMRGVLLPPGSAAILSYEYWQRRYGGDSKVLGQEVLSTGQRGPRIVGVLAPGFRLFFPPGANTDAAPDFWVANNIGYDNAHRNLMTMGAIGRLKNGVGLEEAQRRVDRAAADFRRNSTEWAGYDKAIRVEPMHRHLVAEVRPAILALMGSVAFLLLIACANVANLLLVRASLRAREMAMRAALGSGRRRLMQQLLTEALLLSSLGVAMGVGLAWLGIRALVAIAPANLPRIESAAIDWQVLVFAAAAGLAAACVFGVAPAWRAARPDVMQALRGGGPAAVLGSGRLLRNGVVIGEVALSFVLLIGAGLMLRSFVALQRIDPGYEPRGLLTFMLARNWPLTRQEGRQELLREIQDRLRQLPGVKSVSASVAFPLTGNPRMGSFATQPARPGEATAVGADFEFVLPGYFETLRTPLLAGRALTEEDNVPGRRVAVIDELLAARAFPNGSAVGKRILIPWPDMPWVEVVGVVAHQRAASLADPGREAIFFADGFDGIGVSRHWALRTAGDPAILAGAVRAAIRNLDPQLVITRMQPMTELVDRDQAGTRFQFLLIGAFAGVAVLLASPDFSPHYGKKPLFMA